MGKKSKREKPVEGAMSEEQHRELIAKVVVNLPSGISQEIAQKWITDTTGALQRLLAPLSNMPPVRFVVADKFKVDTSDKAEVKISYLDKDFLFWFGGKTEELADVELPKHHHDLKHDSLDKDILNDLGGADKAEVTFAGMHGLMKLQPNGEDGALLTNGYANIFYIKDVVGVLYAVCVSWYGGGWYVSAGRVDDEYGWDGGCRVFSRNS